MWMMTYRVMMQVIKLIVVGVIICQVFLSMQYFWIYQWFCGSLLVVPAVGSEQK